MAVQAVHRLVGSVDGVETPGIPSCAETWGICYNGMCPGMRFLPFPAPFLFPHLRTTDTNAVCCPCWTTSPRGHESVQGAHRRPPPRACPTYFYFLWSGRHTCLTCRPVSPMDGFDSSPWLARPAATGFRTTRRGRERALRARCSLRDGHADQSQRGGGLGLAWPALLCSARDGSSLEETASRTLHC